MLFAYMQNEVDSTSEVLIIQTMKIYFTFQLFYTIIYVINELTDIESDAMDPSKKSRAFAAKLLSVYEGYFIIGILFVLTLVLLKLFFSTKFVIILLCFLLFLFVNLIYSLVIKRNSSLLLWLRPFIGITSALRYNLGILCMIKVKDINPFYATHYMQILHYSIILFLGMTSIQCVKFLFETKHFKFNCYKFIFIGAQMLFFSIYFFYSYFNDPVMNFVIIANINLNYVIFVYPKASSFHYKIRTIDEIIQVKKNINYDYLTWKILTDNGYYIQLFIFFFIIFWRKLNFFLIEIEKYFVLKNQDIFKRFDINILCIGGVVVIQDQARQIC